MLLFSVHIEGKKKKKKYQSDPNVLLQIIMSLVTKNKSQYKQKRNVLKRYWEVTKFLAGSEDVHQEEYLKHTAAWGW